MTLVFIEILTNPTPTMKTMTLKFAATAALSCLIASCGRDDDKTAEALAKLQVEINAVKDQLSKPAPPPTINLPAPAPAPAPTVNLYIQQNPSQNISVPSAPSRYPVIPMPVAQPQPQPTTMIDYGNGDVAYVNRGSTSYVEEGGEIVYRSGGTRYVYDNYSGGWQNCGYEQPQSYPRFQQGYQGYSQSQLQRGQRQTQPPRQIQHQQVAKNNCVPNLKSGSITRPAQGSRGGNNCIPNLKSGSITRPASSGMASNRGSNGFSNQGRMQVQSRSFGSGMQSLGANRGGFSGGARNMASSGFRGGSSSGGRSFGHR